MISLPIDVTPRGAVRLGDDITCDGFVAGPRYRIQSHVHTDHMSGFNTSKGAQDILTSGATRDLLIAEYNADLAYRENLLPVQHYYSAGEVGVELQSSGHMLGAVQIAVTLPSGLRLGYSGDFQWPLASTIKVDGLVVDSTNGSLNCKPHFTHEELQERLREIVITKIKEGPVYVKAFQGKMQRAMELLSDIVNHPSIGSQRLCRQVAVYKRYGYTIGRLIDKASLEGREVQRSRTYVHYISTGDLDPDEPSDGTTIKLSAFMPPGNEPVHWDSDRSCTVALSDHADFEGTIEYVRSTGARYVVTDWHRSPQFALDLAVALRSRLGIEAKPSSQRKSFAWGT
jgi:putative mRNA 3-end processing factor